MRHIADNATAQASGAAKVGMPARLRCLTARGALGLANTTMGLSVLAKLSRNGAPTVSGSVIEDDPRMTATASYEELSRTASITSRKYSDFTPANVTSMGLRSSTASGILKALRRPAVAGSGAG